MSNLDGIVSLNSLPMSKNLIVCTDVAIFKTMNSTWMLNYT